MSSEGYMLLVCVQPISRKHFIWQMVQKLLFVCLEPHSKAVALFYKSISVGSPATFVTNL